MREDNRFSMRNPNEGSFFMSSISEEDDDYYDEDEEYSEVEGDIYLGEEGNR